MNSGDQSQVGRLGGKCFGPLNHLEGSAVLLLICWGAVFHSDDTFFYLLNSSGPFPTSHQRFQPSVFLVTAMLTAVPFSFIRITASQNIHSVPVIGTESVEQLAWYLHHFCPACKEIHSIKSPKNLASSLDGAGKFMSISSNPSSSTSADQHSCSASLVYSNVITIWVCASSCVHRCTYMRRTQDCLWCLPSFLHEIRILRSLEFK